MLGTIVSSGGTEIVSAGGMDNGATVASGGELDVLGGGTATAPNLLAGGRILVGGTLLLENQVVAASSGGIVLSSGALMELENAQVSGTFNVSSGATVDAVAGLNVLAGTSGYPIVNFGVIEVENGALVLGGKIVNSGALIADNGTLEFVGVVSGGTTLIGNGTVDIQQASGDNVTFQLGGTGGLELDVASAYTGKVSGFGNGGNTSQYIDLTNIAFNGNVHRSYSGNTTSGVLTVTSGTTVVAKIAMVGNYTTSSFKLGADSSGHVQITDPPSSASNTAGSSTVTSGGSNGTSFIDKAWTFSGMVAGFGPHDHTSLPGIGFGAHTMLGHSEDSGDAGGTLLHTAGTHGAKLALLGHYMATSFVTAADWHGGTLVTDAQQTQRPLLTHPQA